MKSPILRDDCADSDCDSRRPINHDRRNRHKPLQRGRPRLDQAVSRAVAYFEQAQADDGSFSAGSGPGITAIVASALLRSGRTVNDPVVARALKYLEGHLHDDGGIYQEGSRYKNYETSLSMVCFKEANKDGRYNELLANAEKFVKEQQWDEDEGHEISSMSYGGAGYGSHERPDLSNTSFLVDALHAVGRGDDDPALQKALVFISRCQNLESEHNTSEFAAKVNDGGFYYTIAAGGQSQAGPTPDGGLRSYGSMTYAGLKSMIYAGVNARRSARQSRIRMDSPATTRWTRTPAWAHKVCTITTTRSPKHSTRSVTSRSSTPTASRTTGEPNWFKS